MGCLWIQILSLDQCLHYSSAVAIKKNLIGNETEKSWTAALSKPSHFFRLLRQSRHLKPKNEGLREVDGWQWQYWIFNY